MSEIKEMESVGRQEQVKVSEQTGVERRQTLLRISNLIWLVAGIVEELIGMRFLLKLIAANPANAFARLVYGLSDLLVGPFLTLTDSPTFGEAILEVPSLIAMLVYALVAWAGARLIWVLFERSRARSISLYERDQRWGAR